MIPLTPQRMKLLAKIVEPDKWRRNTRAKRVTWDQVQATVAKRLVSAS